MQRALHGYERRFRLIGFRVIDEKRVENEPPLSEATIMLAGPDGQIEHTAATGNGPVQALDGALRKALCKFFPEIDAGEACSTSRCACSAPTAASARSCAC